MKLEDQVCNLDLAKKLKELGVKQESLFWWGQNRSVARGEFWDIGYHQLNGNWRGEFSAFTVAELGEKLERASEAALLQAYGYVFNVFNTNTITPTGLQCCMIHPNLVAKMLIYLIENELITL